MHHWFLKKFLKKGISLCKDQKYTCATTQKTKTQNKNILTQLLTTNTSLVLSFLGTQREAKDLNAEMAHKGSDLYSTYCLQGEV